LLPDKIGLFEPVKVEYSLEKAVEMWMKTEGTPQCQGGMVMGKKKDPSFSFNVDWSKGLKASPNTISYVFTKKAITKYNKDLEQVFKETIKKSDAIYGYITHWDVWNRQHVTGTIETRMPGVFWCNYFGKIYVDFFGRKKILSASWVKVEELVNGGILTYLADEPDKDILKSDELEMRAKHHLGIDSFGDPEAYKANFEVKQIKKVPKLELPDIRRELV
jgi:hypothetical protein